LVTLALAGCGGAGDGGEATTSTRAGEALKARIDAMDAPQRDALFLRAVRDAGHDCQGVAGSAYSGRHFDMPSWAARCTNGADWLIMLAADGRALVARREEKTRER
jgi:hypothetical protein